MNETRSRRSFGTTIKHAVFSPYVQGAAALASLATAAASDKLWIRLPALAILVGFIIGLRSTLLIALRNASRWLTWKFPLGLGIGLVVGLVAYPQFANLLRDSVSLFVHKVEIVESTPPNGGVLASLSSPVRFDFSESIPEKYRSSFRPRVEPEYPIQLIWLYDRDISDARTFTIWPARYYKGSTQPEFPPNTQYHLQLSGPMLKVPLDFVFQTPAK